MLCQFSVKNFQCLREEATWDMQAANISEQEETLLLGADGEKFLPLGVLYGPNGGGKTTVLLALYSLISRVMRPVSFLSEPGKEGRMKAAAFPIRPFRFAPASENAATAFELFFRTEAYEYQYQLSVLKNQITAESLARKALGGRRYSTVFTREQGQELKLYGSLKSYGCDDISDDLPLLAYLGITHRRNALVKDAIQWFDNGIYFINYSNPFSELHLQVSETPRLKKLFLAMMAELDLDIVDYRLEEREAGDVDVYTIHEVAGRRYELDLAEESNGTMKLFGLLPFLVDCLTRGAVLVVDELDAKLHPLLLKHIIGMFADPQINLKQAQLLFTSHDLSTMNSDTFRRDEIWFVAKGRDQAAQLYSLAEIKEEDGTKVRKDAKYSKRYLEGRYGADPYLRRMIDWGRRNDYEPGGE